MSKQEEIVGKPTSEAIGGEMAKQEEAPKKLSRKDFVKGAAVGGAGVAAASVLASCAPAATPAPAETAAPVPTCPPCPTPAAAGEAGPVALEVCDPTGAIEVTQLFSARLDTLEGKTICELSNGSWEVDRTFPYIEELLKAQFPTIKFIPHTEFPVIPSPVDADNFAPTIELIKANGCDGVISGNAG